MFYVKKKKKKILIPITVSCSQEKSSIFCKESRKYKHKSLYSFYLYKCIHFKKAKLGVMLSFLGPSIGYASCGDGLLPTPGIYLQVILSF